MMNRDDLWCKLLQLLNQNSPHGTERKVLEDLLPENGIWDNKDNYIVTIGNSESLFCCHLDTVGANPNYTKVMYDETERILFMPRRSTAACLGGDDRCGILCLSAMIDEDIPGTYIFHSGEEKKCIGANYIKETYDLTKFKRAIEFDRKGTRSVISRMGYHKVCSNEFVNKLAGAIDNKYKNDKTGGITDVYYYKDIIPEVTNLSVGYHNEHSISEFIEVLWLIDKFIPAILKVDWESLPTVRNPKDIDNEWYDFSNFRYEQYFKPSDNKYKGDVILFARCDICGYYDKLNESKAGNFRYCDKCKDKGKVNGEEVYGTCDICKFKSLLSKSNSGVLCCKYCKPQIVEDFEINNMNDYIEATVKLRSLGLKEYEIDDFILLNSKNKKSAKEYLDKIINKSAR